MIRRTLVATALILLAGPVRADWASRDDAESASAFVEAERGRRFALTCTREAPGAFDLVLDMVAKSRPLQRPAPLGFTIAGQRFRYTGAMEEGADGLRRITVSAPFDDPTQVRMRGDLKRGIRVSVEDQSSYRLFGFALGGSRRAVEAFEVACARLWSAPPPEPEPAVEAAAPAAEAFEPARDGAWRLELSGGRPAALTEGLAGDRIGLACGPDGGIDWIIDVVETGGRRPSILAAQIAGPSASVRVSAPRVAAREPGLGSFRARFDRTGQRPILRDLGRGAGRISVVRDDGRALAELPLEGAPSIVARLLETCRTRGD